MTLAKITITVELLQGGDSRVHQESDGTASTGQICYLLGRASRSARSAAANITDAIPSDSPESRRLTQLMFEYGYTREPHAVNGLFEIEERQQRKDGGHEDSGHTRGI